MAGAEVEDLDLARTIVEARVQKCMREGAAGEWRGSRAAVPMEPRVQSGWQRGRLENGDGGRDNDPLRFLCGHHITTNALV